MRPRDQEKAVPMRNGWKEASGSLRYDAFVSYSHSVDDRLARSLQQGLHRFAKTLWQIRALRVFRDTSNLAASPGLWSSIQEALTASEYFILLASPESADSNWVVKEIDFWCHNRPSDNIIIVLTGGEIVWDGAAGDFDWELTTSLPECLRGVFSEEPLWIDLRWARTEADVSLRNPLFREVVADLATPLHGRAKDELIGEDIRQHRRNILIRNSVAVGLLTLSVIASVAAYLAVQQRDEAVNQRAIAEKRRNEALRNESFILANLSRDRLQAGDSDEAIRLALKALPNDMLAPDRPYVSEAEAALYEAINSVGSPRRIADLRGHEDLLQPVLFVAFDPEGQRIVTTSPDKTARIWETATGEPIKVLRGHEGTLWHAEFSPDGSRIVTASNDGTARIWDAAQCQVLSTLRGHEGYVIWAEFSSDGRHIITASREGTACVWNATTGKRETVFRGHEMAVNQATLNSTGNRAATISRDGTVRLWDKSNGTEVARLQKMDPNYKTFVAFNPEGTRLIAPAGNGTVHVVAASDGKSVATLQGHTSTVHHGVYSSDGRLILTSSADGTARVWDAATGEEKLLLRVFPGKPTDTMFPNVSQASFSPDGRYIVTAADNGARVWDLQGRVIALLGDSHVRIEQAIFDPSGRYVVTLALGGVPTIWEVCRNFQSRTLFHGKRITHVAGNADGSRLVTAANDGSLRLWDADFGRLIAALEFHQKPITHVEFSPDGSRLLSVAFDGTVKLWDASSAHEINSLCRNTDVVHHAAFGPGGEIATASKDGSVRLWNITGKLLMTFAGHTDEVTRIVFHPSGRELASASKDGTVRLWSTTDGNQAAILRGHQGPVASVVFSPDGRRIATVGSGRDFTVRIWDTRDGQELLVSKGRTGTVTSLAFSPDSSMLLTTDFSGATRTLRVIDGVEVGHFDVCKPRLLPGRHEVIATFGRDGHRVITVTADGMIRIWDSESGVRLVTLHSYAITHWLHPCYTASPLPFPEVHAALLSQNNSMVVTAGEDGKAQVFRILPTTQDVINYGRRLTPQEPSRN
ncbi:MAG: TIR domain-containing protein [Desulfobacterales bacterium]|jgi:WD40 repeat protein